MAIALLHTTGDPGIDLTLLGVMEVLDAAFPDRLLGVYLSGSYAEGEVVDASDIDGLVVFKGSLAPEERERFRLVAHACSLLCGRLIDLAPRGEDELLREGELPAKAASRILLYGEDICARVPAMSVERYTLLMLHGSLFYLSHTRGRPAILPIPPTYPDPDDEFYGYTRDGMHGVNGWRGPGTKALVGGATLAATTLVAIRTGHCAMRSGESVTAYRERVGGEWTGFLGELYLRCKQEWGYREPAASCDRRRLRALCRRMLAFENHYLAACKEHLLAESRGGDENRRTLAIDALGRLRY